VTGLRTSSNGYLALDPSVFRISFGVLTVAALPPSVLTGSGASSGDVLTWNGSAAGWAAPTGGGAAVLDLEGGSEATTLYGADVDGGDEATLYHPLFDFDDGGP